MTVITFATKTEVFSFLQALENIGVHGNIVPTPKQLKMGCGLSVGVNDNYLRYVSALLNYGGYGTFKGVYKITFKNGVKSMTKLL